MQLVHPPLTLVAATIYALLAGSALAAPLNQKETEAYPLAELSLKGVTALLSASNLLDKACDSCYRRNNYWFGAGRSVEARLKYAF